MNGLVQQRNRGRQLTQRVLLVVAIVAIGVLVALPGALAREPLTVVYPANGSRSLSLFRGPCGDIGVLDAGPDTATRALEWIDRLGGRSRVRWVAASHYLDRVSNVAALATAPGVALEAVYDRGEAETADVDPYGPYIAWAAETDLRTSVTAGSVLELCPGDSPVTFTVVGVDGATTSGERLPATDERDKAMCLHVEYGAFDLASCSDVAGSTASGRVDVESAVAEQFGDVEVVTVNAHGSASSSNEAYVGALSPEVAVVQVGPNDDDEPNLEVLQRWSASADVLQTQSREDGSLLAGTITITTNGNEAFSARSSALPYDTRYPLDEAPATATATTASSVEGTPAARAVAEGECVAWNPEAERASASTDLPARVVTRAELAACVEVLVREAGQQLPDTNVDAFTDDEGRADEPLLDRLAAADILSGTNEQYRPEEPVVRGQLATVLVRALEYLSGNDLAASTDYFVDDSLSFHQANINRAAAAGVTEPSVSGQFEPDGLVTRLEAATSLRRALELATQL